jgi:hypothetical protein
MPTVWPPQGEASFEYKIPCCNCPPYCGNLNITSIVFPGMPPTLEEAVEAMNLYATGCRMFSFPITSDYEYTGRGYSQSGDTVSFSGGVTLAPGIESAGALYAAEIYMAVQAGTAVINASYFTECSAGFNVSSQGIIIIAGEGVFEEIYIGSSSFPLIINIPEPTCLTIYVSSETACECPPPTPPDPPPECDQTIASASFSFSITMPGMVVSPIEIDYDSGTLVCS